MQTPLKQGYDGDGGAVIAKFLEVKSGYCVHFASAMALMARTLGIPSRVTEGYLPGTSNGGSVEQPGYLHRDQRRSARVARAVLRRCRLGAVRADRVARVRPGVHRAADRRAAPRAPTPAPRARQVTPPLAPEITDGPNSATGAPTNRGCSRSLSAFGVTLLVIAAAAHPGVPPQAPPAQPFQEAQRRVGPREPRRGMNCATPRATSAGRCPTPRRPARSRSGLTDAVRTRRATSAAVRQAADRRRTRIVRAARPIHRPRSRPTTCRRRSPDSRRGPAEPLRVKALLAPVSLIPPSWSPAAGVRPTNA